jgi:hypothetical protein
MDTDTQWRPVTEAEKNSVHEQLERVLAHSTFKTSRRCSHLLRYIVESCLVEDNQKLKERTLGLEVFGRDADYDTNLDPVVRTTAGEIRKRIAQYYYEQGHENEIRIDLPSGSYSPEFHLPPEKMETAVAPEQRAGVAEFLAVVPRSKKVSIRSRTSALLAIAATSLALIFGGWLAPWKQQSPVQQFWGPVLHSQASVLVCVGEAPVAASDRGREPSISDSIFRTKHVYFSDALALSNLTGFLGKHERHYSVKSCADVTFTDLQQGPVILIAGFHNSWTLRLTDPLRFHFVRASGSELYQIEDRENVSRKDWTVDFSKPYSTLAHDYAIVARFHDPTTDQPVVIAAGIGENGTAAAAEFLIGDKYLREVAKRVPANSSPENIEAVIETRVIDGKSGPPRVVAVHPW